MKQVPNAGRLGMALLIFSALVAVGWGKDEPKPAASDGQPPATPAPATAVPAGDLAIFRPFADGLLARSYGALYADLARKIQGFDQARLHEIILGREIALFGLNREDYPTAAGRKQAVEKIHQAAEGEIQQKCGPEVLKAFKDYDASRKYHQTLNTINQTLLFKGAPLNLAQYEYLVALLKSYEKNAPIPSLSKAEMDQYIQARELDHAIMLTAMAAHLLPVQLGEMKLEFATEIRYLRYFELRNSQARQGKPSRDAQGPRASAPLQNRTESGP